MKECFHSTGQFFAVLLSVKVQFPFLNLVYWMRINVSLIHNISYGTPNFAYKVSKHELCPLVVLPNAKFHHHRWPQFNHLHVILKLMHQCYSIAYINYCLAHPTVNIILFNDQTAFIGNYSDINISFTCAFNIQIYENSISLSQQRFRPI